MGHPALFVAGKLAVPEHRRSFLVWQALGILDLVTAVSLGALGQFIRPADFSTFAGGTAPMTVLPLSLIPTFAVPLLLILHLVSIAQARRWKPATAAARGLRSLPATS